MATNREKVLGYLISREHKRVSVTDIAHECGLARRQTLTALHGLKDRGLGDQLAPSGSGHWLYTPPITHKLTKEQQTTFVPIGWESRVRVVGIFGDKYLFAPLTTDGGDTGIRIFGEVIFGDIEFEHGDWV